MYACGRISKKGEYIVFFDTHAHYDDEAFDEDREELLRSLKDSGVTLVLDPGADMPSSRKSIELSDRFDFIYSAVGVHPHDAKSMTDADFDELCEMSKGEKVLAIGEIGLDYHYDFSPRDIQKKRFYDQLCLARELGLPVIIHEREAAKDCLDIISAFSDLKGVYHCYSGSWETAKIILNMGWYLSFTGAVTFKNARHAPEVARKMPSDRIMIETDSPYMAPVPVRGTRNNSANLIYICEKIAELRGLTVQETAALTMENGKRFFGIE